MRCYELATFEPGGMRLTARQKPKPRAGEVLLRIEAAALNHRDLMIARGVFPLALPLVPVSDGAGVVAEVGDEVDSFTVGDRVCPMFLQGWESGPRAGAFPRAAPLGGPLDGMLRDYALFPADNLARVPAHLSSVEAATLPTAALTAWNVLSAAAVKPGTTVLVEGTGGVSIFALQFAKLMGARVIVTSSSDTKLNRARELGCDETINYKAQPNWGDAALEWSGHGVDVVVDVGGQATLPQACKAIREGGFIGVVGALSGFQTTVDGLSVVFKQARLQGFVVGNRQGFREMCVAIEQHEVRPVIDRQFTFDEAPLAYSYLQAAQHFGKIVVTL